MPIKKIHFIAYLANVDSTILKFNLKHGFKIKGESFKKAYKILSTLEKKSFEDFKSFCATYACYNSESDKIFWITNSFGVYAKTLDSSLDVTSHPEIWEYYKKYMDGYLKPVIKLMRLFKEGNIFLAASRWFYYENNTPIAALGYEAGYFVKERSLYTLKNREIEDLQKFIEDIKYPFKEPSVQLAFENFALSYRILNINLSFLALMMSLESLFNPGGQGELAFRISRNTALLVGRDKRDSELIWKKMKMKNGLYDKRSKIVHTGKSDVITDDDILTLRDYVRRSIKEFYRIGKRKMEVLDLLNSSGFGERLWIKKAKDEKK